METAYSWLRSMAWLWRDQFFSWEPLLETGWTRTPGSKVRCLEQVIYLRMDRIHVRKVKLTEWISQVKYENGACSSPLRKAEWFQSGDGYTKILSKTGQRTKTVLSHDTSITQAKPIWCVDMYENTKGKKYVTSGLLTKFFLHYNANIPLYYLLSSVWIQISFT